MNSIRFTLIVGCTVGLFQCKKADDPAPVTPGPPAATTTYALGWAGNEDLSKVPVSTNFGFASAGTFPSSVDLSAYLPPVASQGSYGTCVSWAAGYYMKTALEGLTNNYSAAQLANAANQISPRDLFTSVPDNQKGANCGGSSFLANLDVLQNRGAATLTTVPYSNLGNCAAASASTAWNTDAAKHKIKNYRTITASVNAIKEQLANKTPVLLGAFLSDNFMTWNSDNVLSSNTTYTQVGQHAGHALTIVGYDDRKGAGGAFKVVNSWGTNWGSKGYIWVDYTFLVTTFAQPDGTGNRVLMVMTDATAKPTTPTTPTAPTTPVGKSGIDLFAWVDSDFSTYSKTGNPQSRSVDLNIFNVGTRTATPQTPWKVYYMYYNAYNANDYGLLLYETFTTKGLATNTYQCTNDNCNFNVSLPAYGNLSHQVFGTEDGIELSYTMPATLSGSYYLVLLADPENVLNDDDKTDNFFYTTDNPLVFRNGYAARQSADGVASNPFSFKNLMRPTDSKALRRPFNSAITPTNRNAYSPDEIVDFLRQQQRNGGLARKQIEYARANPSANVQPAR